MQFSSDEREIMRRAADRIWDAGCTCVQARDARGTPVLPNKPEAVVWCAVGAMLKEGGDYILLEKINRELGPSKEHPYGIASINNIRGPRAASVVLREMAEKALVPVDGIA